MTGTIPQEVLRLWNVESKDAQERAWEAFVARQSDLILRVSHRFARDKDLAMDCYAFVLEQLREDNCRRLKAYAPETASTFESWLAVVTRRLCVDLVRREYGRERFATRSSEERHATRGRLADLLAAEVEVEKIADDKSPDDAVIAQEVQVALDESLRRLDPRDRMMVKLRFESGLSAVEIGRIMAFPTPFHVYRRLNRVLALLRQMLQDRGIEADELAQ